MLRYAWSLVGDRGQAEDLLQETFVTAWSKRKRASIVGKSLLPWLLAICRNHVRNHLRRRARRHAVPLDSVAELQESKLGNQFGWIHEAIESLSPVDRRICQMCLVEGLSYAQAAEQIQSTPGAVGKRLQRAKAQLRKTLGKEYWVGEKLQ